MTPAPTYHFIEGDIFDILPGLEDGSFDACFCDPPYGLKFMGKRWDHGVPSADAWREVFRLLKPGAPLLAFGGTRTVHRLTCAIEDAGFEIRDMCMWLYGSGFPKSHDISKGIDKLLGAERDVTREAKAPDDYRPDHIDMDPRSSIDRERRDTPATEYGIQWQGYGTALKPAWEPVILAMKPIDGTYAENALEYGVAGLNVDGSRIGASGGGGNCPGGDQCHCDLSDRSGPYSATKHPVRQSGEMGRWPANLILSHSGQCVEGTDGIHVCADDCPVRLLDEQGKDVGAGRSAYPGRQDLADKYAGSEIDMSKAVTSFGGQRAGLSRSDSGSVSRFFYCAKVSTRERNLGGIDCKHPTLKPLALCRYLATLILPPAHTDGSPRSLLTPFSGAGSEVLGSLRAGWEYVIGVESDPESMAWAEARVAAGLGETVPLAHANKRGPVPTPRQPRQPRQGAGSGIDAAALNEGID